MASMLVRETALKQARHVVVKIGTQLLTKQTSAGLGIDTAFVRKIVAQIATLHRTGYQITVVSSGAIGAGCCELKLTERPTDVASAQAVAAVGQRRLMTHWQTALSKVGLGCGQVLLTRSDFDDRVRFLNVRNCVARLHELQCIPVFNENDSVAVEELRFGDNDLLAGLTANAVKAEALILLTGVDGLLDDDGSVIDYVDDVVAFGSKVRAVKSTWGSGGMSTKLEAARVVTDAGEVAVVANGRTKDVLLRILRGERIGTVFAPAERKLDGRQRWIGLTARPAGSVTIDEGAVAALTQRGKSLLATGISEVTGRFERGDVLLVRSQPGREVGRGLSNYSAEELRLIKGHKSSAFEALLGRPGYAEVIHRDNLVVLS